MRVLSMDIFRTILGLCMVGCAFGQVYYSGKCPEVQVKQEFDLQQYVGRWYEMKRLFAVFQMFSDCVTAEYTPLGNGVVLVNNTGYDVFNERYFTAIGDAVQQDESEASKLGVLFPGSPGRGNYWVLDTDYKTYTVVWSCSESNVLGYTYNSQNTWILTRSPEGIPPEREEAITTMLKNYNIGVPVRRTAQMNCPGRESVKM